MVRRATPFTVMAKVPANTRPQVFVPATSVNTQGTPIGDPWYTKWWVWTIVGSVVVGGIVTGGVLAQPAPVGSPKGWTATVNW